MLLSPIFHGWSDNAAAANVIYLFIWLDVWPPFLVEMSEFIYTIWLLEPESVFKLWLEIFFRIDVDGIPEA